VIQLPSLRERTEDIEELARYFAAHFAGKVNRNEIKISDAYIHALKRHHWKGNIRELKNVIERSVILTDGPVLLPETLPNDFISSQPYEDKTMSAFDLASAEKIHIQKVLNYTRGNKTEAARLLNIALTTLYRKLEEYKIG
jgi:DNA-binding NtrC family response regulator